MFIGLRSITISASSRIAMTVTTSVLAAARAITGLSTASMTTFASGEESQRWFQPPMSLREKGET